ncbi:serine/threonine dehydratase [Glaciecola sp. KUL10]|uniref:serine/threonine dehydratase n=1 Tax=Glaciecola sp. (strain KUL10) TaxID=2161813 RepID=UPI000D788099|nr:serine/threonine dehydratase [Glaciecola sp. KUL10]GBL06045.1 threonine dehydratase [Glaciecola sp. KUL10]
MLSFKDIEAAQARIKPYIQTTPILTSNLLNTWLGHEVYFKADCLQTTGAFKLRGATNLLAKRAETKTLPSKIVANSSGNHAQAVAYAARQFNIPATIYTTESVSEIKAAATEYYGAQVKKFALRVDADRAVADAAKEPDTLWVPPFNHPDIIAGQGTVTAEAIAQLHSQSVTPDAIFAPCGGGGLLSGAILSARALLPNAKVLGSEPQLANDASRSLQSGKIECLDGPADTLADGAATPSVGEHTFEIIQQVDDFYEVDEVQIAYWTQWLQHLLKLHVEPTCAMSMAAVVAWCLEQASPQKVLVLVTGGNISAASMRKIWEKDYLLQPPILNEQ